MFTPVRAKHSKSVSLIDCISVGVDRMPRNFEPMRNRSRQRSELTDITEKVVISDAFVEGKLEIPKLLVRKVHDLYFEPKYEKFQLRTIWSLLCFQMRNDPRGDAILGDLYIECKHPNSVKQMTKLISAFAKSLNAENRF